MISLTHNPNSFVTLKEKEKLVRAEYDSAGKLKRMFPISSDSQTEPTGHFLDIKDFEKGSTDLAYPSSGTGYYTLDAGDGRIELWFGTTWEDSQTKIRDITLQEWVDEVADIFLGKKEEVAR